MRTALALLLFAVVTPSFAQQFTDGSASVLSSADSQTLREALMSSLNDPTSALIAGMHRSDITDKVFCGVINAKNSFGGYVGFRPFTFAPEYRVFAMLPDISNFQGLSQEEMAGRLQSMKLNLKFCIRDPK